MWVQLHIAGKHSICVWLNEPIGKNKQFPSWLGKGGPAMTNGHHSSATPTMDQDCFALSQNGFLCTLQRGLFSLMSCTFETPVWSTSWIRVEKAQANCVKGSDVISHAWSCNLPQSRSLMSKGAMALDMSWSRKETQLAWEWKQCIKMVVWAQTVLPLWHLWQRVKHDQNCGKGCCCRWWQCHSQTLKASQKPFWESQQSWDSVGFWQLVCQTETAWWFLALFSSGTCFSLDPSMQNRGCHQRELSFLATNSQRWPGWPQSASWQNESSGTAQTRPNGEKHRTCWCPIQGRPPVPRYPRLGIRE